MKKDNPERQQQIKKSLCYGLTALVVIVLAIIIYFCIERADQLGSAVSSVISSLMPIIYGVVIAYLLCPMYNFFHRHIYSGLQKKHSQKTARRVSNGLSILLSILVLIGVIVALIVLIVPRLVTSVIEIINTIPTYITQIRNGLTSLLANYPEIQEAVVNGFNSLVDYVQNWVSTHLDFDTIMEALDSDTVDDVLTTLGDVISSISSGVVSIIVFIKNVIIGLIVACYLLAGKQHMCGQAKKIIYSIFPQKASNVIMENLRYAHHAFSGFISGKILDSIIVGILCFIGCEILQIPYPMLISVIIGVTNVIPFFGPFIGAIPCAIFILIISPIKALIFIIFILILQQFDGNYLGPKILGDATGIRSFWVIFSLLLFGGMFGVIGMILGVPVFSVIYHIVDQVTQYLLKKKNLSTDTKDYELLGHVDDGVYQKVPDPAYEKDPYNLSASSKHFAEQTERVKTRIRQYEDEKEELENSGKSEKAEQKEKTLDESSSEDGKENNNDKTE